MTDDTDERGEEYVARQRGGDHLPECRPQPWNPHTGAPCICDRLRDCEARVQERCALEIDHGPQMGNSLEWMLNPIRKHHYERGLSAALDAVDAERRAYYADCVNDGRQPDGTTIATFRLSLAAIDAVRGESNG
jgi:hypothetical protein